MNFKELLLRAQDGDKDAAAAIVEMYRPLLLRGSIIHGVFDEDLYQELCETVLKCIRNFTI
ncbi:MAG: helix-turn-helix domain-containing protein [Faecousia sp.]